MQRVKQEKSKTYNYTQSKQANLCVNDCFEVKLHGLAGLLNYISLNVDFMDSLDKQITNQTNRSKYPTLNY